jgi:CRISPR system Cascade subunit CasE
MNNLFLSRISLREEPSVATLGPILFDVSGHHRSEVSRRLVWTLFADSPDRKRDFLWRESQAGRFFVLSSRAPEDRHRLFNIETKSFEPALSSGDRLVFSLRANATIVRSRGNAERGGKREDVVMAALKSIPQEQRASARKELIQREGLAWLKRQGAAAGFDFDDDEVAVDGYEPITIRGAGKKALRLTIIEFEGVLTVRNPALFIEKMARGFGRGKAFGLGLMLVRRALVR